MPAPPARIRSASVPCGLNSTSTSPARILARELLVLADVGADHLLDHVPVEQLAQAPAVDAAIVADHRQALDAARDDGVDQVLGNPAQAEAARDDRHVVAQQAGERVTGAGTYFLQRLSPCSACASIINT